MLKNILNTCQYLLLALRYKGRNIMLVKIASEYVYETERQPLHLDTGHIYPLYLLHILAENGGKTISEEHAHLAFSHNRGALMRDGSFRHDAF